MSAIVGVAPKKLLPALSLLVVTLLATPPRFLEAQQQPATSAGLRPLPDMTLKVDVEMVLLPVSVTDEYYRAFSGLRAEHFQVYEDKVAQQIVSVSERDTPLSVGLVFDGSGSMANKIELCKQAARAFFRYAHPEDEYFLIEFNDRVHLLSPFTARVERIMAHIGAARGGGRTALYDAIYLAIAEMRNAHYSRKVLLVLSDGADNASRYTERHVRNALRESDIQIYTIGVFNPVGFRYSREEAYGPTNMAKLAKVSGGTGFVLYNPADLPDIAAAISRELRTQYEITYYPSNRAHDGQWRKLRVKVKAPRGAPRLDLRTRSGYYAPSF